MRCARPGLPDPGLDTKAGNAASYCLPSCAAPLRSNCLGCPSEERLSQEPLHPPCADSHRQSASRDGLPSPRQVALPLEERGRDPLPACLGLFGVLCTHQSCNTQAEGSLTHSCRFPLKGSIAQLLEAFLLTKLPPSCLGPKSEQEAPNRKLWVPCVQLDAVLHSSTHRLNHLQAMVSFHATLPKSAYLPGI